MQERDNREPDLSQLTNDVCFSKPGEPVIFKGTDMPDGIYKLQKFSSSAALVVLRGVVYYVNDGYVSSHERLCNPYFGGEVFAVDSHDIDLKMIASFDQN